MSQQTQGVVTKVNESHSAANSARKWTKKAFLINDEWYGAFVNSDNKEALSSVNEGDAVEVSYETKGDYKNLVGIKLTAKYKDEAVDRSYDGPIKGSVKPYSPQEKDFRITYLASRKDAIEFVKAAHQLGMITFGKKKADEMDIFQELVNTYAMVFAMKAWEIAPEVQPETFVEPTAKAVNE